MDAVEFDHPLSAKVRGCVSLDETLPLIKLTYMNFTNGTYVAPLLNSSTPPGLTSWADYWLTKHYCIVRARKRQDANFIHKLTHLYH